MTTDGLSNLVTSLGDGCQESTAAEPRPLSTKILKLRSELAAARRQEEGWRKALDASNQGAWSLDVSTDMFFYSDTWRRIRGIPSEEVVDLSVEGWISGVHPEDRAHVLSAIEAQNSGGLDFSLIHYRERHRNGQWVWFESRSSILERNTSGRASRVVGTDVDITERKAAEQTLEDLSRKLSLAMEVAGVGVFEADLDSGDVQWDPRLLGMYGSIEAEALVMNGSLFFEERLHPGDREACVKRVAEGVESGLPFENQFRIVRPGGEVRHLRSRSVPFSDNAGRRKLLGVNWDVTRDMAVQEELRVSVAEAEARSEALEQARETIRRISVLDELTGLLNRRGFNEQLELWRKGEADFCAVLHLDLDHFKNINDKFGHHAGDVVLQTAAARIRGWLSENDVLARWGGDEFVVLVGLHRTFQDVVGVAEAIVGALGLPMEAGGIACSIGVSIGIAMCDGVATPDRLLIEADIALYEAKSLGKGRVSMIARTG